MKNRVYIGVDFYSSYCTSLPCHPMFAASNGSTAKAREKSGTFMARKANNGSIIMVKQKREETRSSHVYGPKKPSGMLILFPFPA